MIPWGYQPYCLCASASFASINFSSLSSRALRSAFSACCRRTISCCFLFTFSFRNHTILFIQPFLFESPRLINLRRCHLCFNPVNRLLHTLFKLSRCGRFHSAPLQHVTHLLLPEERGQKARRTPEIASAFHPRSEASCGMVCFYPVIGPRPIGRGELE